MKRFLGILMLSVMAVSAHAQREKMSREEKDEKNQARLDRINNKNDVALFRRQMLALKEFAAERQKIPAVQKANHGMAVKVTAVVDTEALESGADVKVLTGYIRQDVGDNGTNMYELQFDRSQRRIISVKRTPEAIDADREASEEKEEKSSAKKPAAVKKAVPKKNKDEDDDDEEPEDEKPVKGRSQDNDDE